MSEPFLCEVCNAYIYYMNKDKHESTKIHKNHPTNYDNRHHQLKNNNEVHCTICDKNLTIAGLYSHNKSINHMISVKLTKGEMVSKHKNYLCKICNTKVKWRNLYDHEKNHEDHMMILTSNRIKSYCGLCCIYVYMWNRHAIASSHQNNVEIYEKKMTARDKSNNIDDLNVNSSDSEATI